MPISIVTRPAVAGLLCSLSFAVQAVADDARRHAIDIPPQDLGVALQLLSKQSGTDLIYRPEQVRGLRTRGAVGELSTQEAVVELLEGTRLTVRADPSGALLIATPLASPGAAGQTPEHDRQGSGEVGKNASQEFRLAQVDQAPAGSSRVDAEFSESGTVLKDIIVTASRRQESLSQVGSAVSAISGDDLLERSSDSLQDYVAFIPGVTLTSQGAAGYGVVAIRGIAPQGSGATTATYVDEIPVGASGATTRAAFFTTDLDPEDLERVEVLKGPQGTLYGSSSMGGVIKYVTKNPNLTGSEVSLFEEGNYTQHGDAAGEKVRGSWSTALIDGILGVRASAYYRHDPGFIDDIGVQGSGVGGVNANGGRLSLLYEPFDALSVKLSAMFQETRQGGLSVVDTNTSNYEPTYGAYRQLRYEPEGLDENTRVFSAEIHDHFAIFDLLSATGYSQIHPMGYADDTAAFEAYGLGPVSPANPAQDVSHDDTEKITQEFRLTSGRLGIAEFMLGAFYQHERDHFAFIDSLTLSPDVNFAFRGGDGTLSEYAGFLDATLYFSPRFDLTLGYRYSRIDQTQIQSTGGELYNPVNSNVLSETFQTFSEGPSTYLAAARYHVDENLLLYARTASGYRPGGGRPLPPGTPAGFADFYNSDKLWSYEVGEKLKAWQGRLALDADAFYIDWDNIQAPQPVPGTPFILNGNAGAAHSRGLELQTAFIPVRGLTVGGNGAYTDARFLQTVPEIVTAGETLTYVPRFAGSAYAQYARPIRGGWQGILECDYRYEGYRVDTYRVPLPGYGLWDTRFGVRNDRWQVNFYVKNLGDKYGRAGSNGGGGGPLPYYFVIETPRTFGLSFQQHF
jgi:iron complex outermembrane recepter protein